MTRLGGATLPAATRFFHGYVENAMHETKEASSPRKPDLRDTPPTSLSDNDIQSPVQDPQRETSNDPQRPRSGPDIVKPGVGGQATGQTSRQ